MSDGFVDAWGAEAGGGVDTNAFESKSRCSAYACHREPCQDCRRTRAAGDDADPAILRARTIKQRERACAEGWGEALWSVCR